MKKSFYQAQTSYFWRVWWISEDQIRVQNDDFSRRNQQTTIGMLFPCPHFKLTELVNMFVLFEYSTWLWNDWIDFEQVSYFLLLREQLFDQVLTLRISFRIQTVVVSHPVWPQSFRWKICFTIDRQSKIFQFESHFKIIYYLQAKKIVTLFLRRIRMWFENTRDLLPTVFPSRINFIFELFELKYQLEHILVICIQDIFINISLKIKNHIKNQIFPQYVMPYRNKYGLLWDKRWNAEEEKYTSQPHYTLML